MSQLACGTSSSNLASLAVTAVEHLGCALRDVVELHVRAEVLEGAAERQVDALLAVDDLHLLDGVAVEQAQALLRGDLTGVGGGQQVERR